MFIWQRQCWSAPVATETPSVGSVGETEGGLRTAASILLSSRRERERRLFVFFSALVKRSPVCCLDPLRLGAKVADRRSLFALRSALYHRCTERRRRPVSHTHTHTKTSNKTDKNLPAVVLNSVSGQRLRLKDCVFNLDWLTNIEIYEWKRQWREHCIKVLCRLKLASLANS